ncbi:MAG TPA: helix-turn-helix domain-containing protein [Phycisphaerales bacterium]|nr:helix-turn-helix domain-containing protein [Phycisphaerales bacterium]HRQ75708.1 helix-turn-helix domain-containing protein [Phycisphaerales bacterium]
MAKMFYTIEEVATKLGKSVDEVKAMAKSGQIQEFRDRDKLMFKVDQIDLLAGGDDDDLEDVSLSLDDSRGGSGIALADSDLGLSDSREGTGISVFDTDHGKEGEASDQTAVGETLDDELSLESVGSGSGLLDLTKESDDTALGAELLEEVYSGDENIELPANASGLFEAASDAGHEDFAPVGGAVAMPMVLESYDGSGSGLGVGLLVGAVAALVCVAIMAIVGLSGATPALAMSFAGNIWVWVGALAGLTLIFGVIGWFIGRATE